MSTGEGVNIDRFYGRVVELCVVCTVCASLVAAIFLYYEPAIRASQETALKMGLTNIRYAIQIYTVRHGRPPANLRVLLTTGYTLAGEKTSVFVPGYLQAQALDRNGYPIDPFGRRFDYDSEMGTVRSATDGYGLW